MKLYYVLFSDLSMEFATFQLNQIQVRAIFTYQPDRKDQKPAKCFESQVIFEPADYRLSEKRSVQFESGKSASNYSPEKAQKIARRRENRSAGQKSGIP